MNNPIVVAASIVGVLGLRYLGHKFRAWKTYRNALPDEQREMLFWNDRNYERLEDVTNNVIWIYALVLAVPLILFVFYRLMWG